MPAKVGAVKVINIGSSSIFNIGDVYAMAPYSTAKTFAGGGSFNTGDGIEIDLSNSSTNVNDMDQVDQPITVDVE
ncbi:spore germination protein GerPA [Pontibacillus halophilus JSM 076056 = DSM 19796]|uniref:Spore germination protein GerPA n=1 Tax=Pontibacillus halophilus JSM 076056 = DSM 19796 TaxID=1385510 RepID=A0A0A5GHA3_9BACI|nr:spore germination protein [Pontibacillus halophilus]KGX92641.1 spore germination protein GerPA [Pontibacillus halophilus JSM 076056 = DSM 19796]